MLADEIEPMNNVFATRDLEKDTKMREEFLGRFMNHI